MADVEKDTGWVSNVPPVNEQRAEPVRDGQPHSPDGIKKRKRVSGTFSGPTPDDDVILASGRTERQKRTKAGQVVKKALDEHMKSFVLPKPK